jgi:hypothetical protein
MEWGCKMRVRVVISCDFTEEDRRNLANPNKWGGAVAEGKPMLSRDDLEDLIRMFGDPAYGADWDDLYTQPDDENE